MFFRTRFDAVFFALLLVGLCLAEMAPNLGFPERLLSGLTYVSAPDQRVDTRLQLREGGSGPKQDPSKTSSRPE